MNRHDRRVVAMQARRKSYFEAVQVNNHDLWRVAGTFIEARLCGCIKCGSNEGQTRAYADIDHVPAGNELAKGITIVSTTNQLCPQCRGDAAVPLSAEQHDELSRLDEQLLASPQYRGCPCCSWRVEWSRCDPETVARLTGHMQ